ncbi:MAG: hypothetical protein JWL97_3929, partial [Gemmatimonadales bacterium]|nr:hypothetical protein [Gemmatimonadales bacterium]
PHERGEDFDGKGGKDFKIGSPPRAWGGRV